MTTRKNPYQAWVAQYDEWAKAGLSLPLGGLNLPPPPGINRTAGPVLLFSPHPDDECITGALPLRLSREAGLPVVNIAVTLGSNEGRRAGRWAELQQACSYLDWSVECSVPQGLSRITPKTRGEDPGHWRSAVSAIREILLRNQPRAVVFPHVRDWNGTHIGTHHLVMDALAGMPPEFSCVLISTEFWGAMDTPNLMVESGVEDVADLVAALSLHVGEVQRNPYHLTLPAWMQDNVRRGGELVGGQGGAAPAYRFATLYRILGWKKGETRTMPLAIRMVARGQSVSNWWADVQVALAAE